MGYAFSFGFVFLRTGIAHFVAAALNERIKKPVSMDGHACAIDGRKSVHSRAIRGRDERRNEARNKARRTYGMVYNDATRNGNERDKQSTRQAHLPDLPAKWSGARLCWTAVRGV